MFGLAQPTAGARAMAAGRAARLALALDGTHALAACTGSAARLALRLRVKWQDALAPRPPTSEWLARCVWDSGRAHDAAALARWQPRRPSFVVVDTGQPGDWLSALHALQQRDAALLHPVRMLWLLPPPGLATPALRWTSVADA